MFKLYKLLNRSTSLRALFSSNVNQIDVTSQIEKAERVFSGIQPTGSMHLGNYLGAILQWVQLQNRNKNIILSIVDLHSMTLPHDPKQLSNNILEMTATLLGCGIDPSKVILFQQSTVPAHTELCWNLSCLSTMARLAHLPQYKEKSKNLKDIPLGLFVYPVLQAADILAYKATHIPVGEDQVQHIQLTQELARMFNRRFGNTFPIPHAIVTDGNTSRLKSLRDPMKKMSKSDPDSKSRICLLDKPEDILKNIKKAVTDFTSEVSYDPQTRPGISNLLSIHSLLSNKPIEEICKENDSINTGQYKLVVAEAVIDHIKPIQEKIVQLMNQPDYLVSILQNGSDKANEIADATLSEVKTKLGVNLHQRVREEIQTNL